MRVQSLAHIAFISNCSGLQAAIACVFSKIENTFFFYTGRLDLGLLNTGGSGDLCFQLWRERKVTDCLHNSVQGDLKGRHEHRDRVMRKRRVIYPNIKQRKRLLIQSPFQPRDIL